MVVYIREAHAADGESPLRSGPRINDPRSLAERQEVAKTCAAAVKFTMPMVIDRIDDHAASAYGGFPDRLYVVDRDGRIAYQGAPGPRGFKPDEMESALEDVLSRGGVMRSWRF